MRLKPVFICLIAAAGFQAYGADYTEEVYKTPDTWSKHITPSGVKKASEPIKIGEKGGYLTFAFTNRLQVKAAVGASAQAYKYLRAKLSDAELGHGRVSVNLNMRLGMNFNRQRNNPREYYIYYDALDVEAGASDGAFRLTNANIVFDNVADGLKVTLGRAYISHLADYKLDGGGAEYTFLYGALTAFIYYGLPVSYYLNLKTQVAGGGLDYKFFRDKSRLRAEYSYFISDLKGYNKNDMTMRLRLDQKIVFTNLYAQFDVIKDASIYKFGADGNIEATRTGFSVYLRGQYGKNRPGINPYISSFEAVTGEESEYFLWGGEIYQGITENIMAAVGYEQRHNYDRSYADRDYTRVYGNVDLIGLIHPDNFLSILGDYYYIPKYGDNPKEDKFTAGVRTTQRITADLDVWAGANISSYGYKVNPIILNPLHDPYLTDFDYGSKSQNTAAVYIGAQWTYKNQLSVQLDYQYENTNLFDAYDPQYDNCHTVALWINFLI